MLKIVATRVTRMPASPTAWSSSSVTSFGGGGGGGGDGTKDVEEFVGEEDGGGDGEGGGGLGYVLHTAVSVSVPALQDLVPARA